MFQEPAKRDHSLADADMVTFTDALCSNMTRDLSDLANFGVTTLKF